jgi:quercetin dioxygenase-like cupin family protein
MASVVSGAAETPLDAMWRRAQRTSAFASMFAVLTIIPATAYSGALPPLHPLADPHHVACIPADGHQGQPGCWELGSIPISTPAGQPLYWHVYEFPSVAKAQQVRDDQSQIIEAYGRVWLEAVTVQGWTARGGRHVATVGPMRALSSLPQTASFMEAMFTPGMRSRVHTHPGPEAWVVLEGEQCLETPEGKIRVQAGKSMMVRGGLPMALFGTGKGIRRALVLIIHPTGQALGTTYSEWLPTESCLKTAL